MGLDMFLYRTTSLYSYDDSTRVYISMYGKDLKITKPTKITEEVGYWRKANHIHKWFVDNVQDGVDDCRKYEVSREQLGKLLELCKEVKDKAILKKGEIHVSTTFKDGKVYQNYEDGSVIENAEEISNILPTTSGFFFGSTEYDEYYLRDVEETIEMLEKLLSEKSPEGVWQQFEYTSSW